MGISSQRPGSFTTHGLWLVVIGLQYSVRAFVTSWITLALTEYIRLLYDGVTYES
jgi:hypothetical protein